MFTDVHVDERSFMKLKRPSYFAAFSTLHRQVGLSTASDRFIQSAHQLKSLRLAGSNRARRQRVSAFGPTRAEGSASTIGGALVVSGPAVVVPVQGASRSACCAAFVASECA